MRAENRRIGGRSLNRSGCRKGTTNAEARR